MSGKKPRPMFELLLGSINAYVPPVPPEPPAITSPSANVPDVSVAPYVPVLTKVRN